MVVDYRDGLASTIVDGVGTTRTGCGIMYANREKEQNRSRETEADHVKAE